MRIGWVLVLLLLGCGAPPGPGGTGGGSGSDKCAGQTCSDHGTCWAASGVATCTCASGYLITSGDSLSCEPDRNATGCGGACCTGGQQGYCSQAPCGTTANKKDCCALVGGNWVCVS